MSGDPDPAPVPGYLLAFLALTAHRSAATDRTLVVGALAGGTAAAGWTAIVVAFLPIPPDPDLAVLMIVLGIAAASAAGNRGGAGAGMLAGVSAGTVGALLTMQVVLLLSVLGPARLIPDLVPDALSPADDVANSRIELQDPYLWLLLFGWLIALGQCVADLAIRPPGRTVTADSVTTAP